MSSVKDIVQGTLASYGDRSMDTAIATALDGITESIKWPWSKDEPAPKPRTAGDDVKDKITGAGKWAGDKAKKATDATVKAGKDLKDWASENPGKAGAIGGAGAAGLIGAGYLAKKYRDSRKK